MECRRAARAPSHPAPLPGNLLRRRPPSDARPTRHARHSPPARGSSPSPSQPRLAVSPPPGRSTRRTWSGGQLARRVATDKLVLAAHSTKLSRRFCKRWTDRNVASCLGRHQPSAGRLPNRQRAPSALAAARAASGRATGGRRARSLLGDATRQNVAPAGEIDKCNPIKRTRRDQQENAKKTCGPRRPTGRNTRREEKKAGEARSGTAGRTHAGH